MGFNLNHFASWRSLRLSVKKFNYSFLVFTSCLRYTHMVSGTTALPCIKRRILCHVVEWGV
jgi:hypothetical protein